MRTFFIVLLSLFFFLSSSSQENAKSIPVKYIDDVADKAGVVSVKINANAQKVLLALEKQEIKIYKKLYRKDSNQARQFFAESQTKYAELRSRLAEARSGTTTYLPVLDTFKSSLKFLNENKQFLSKSNLAEDKLNTALGKIDVLENSLANAEAVKQFLKERKASISSYVAGLPMAGDLKKINKEVYYYSAQLKEYKSLLSDKKKLEKKAIELLAQSKLFREFMRKNSQLASMFRIPGESATSLESLQGLQTRASINAIIKDKIEAGGGNASEGFKANLANAQSELNNLKSKTTSFSAGGSNIEIPEGFKPNSQKTKPLLKRLEMGGNIQNQKARYYFPITSDIAFTLGYRLNDKSVIGLGASYKLGLGSGWNNMKLSHEGIGFRSYIDYNLKGKIFVTGGYEQNFKSKINTIEALRDYNSWQTSGLLGFTKKYSINKKVNGNIQLLWDFLSYQQAPRTQPLIFRIGYQFNKK